MSSTPTMTSTAASPMKVKMCQFLYRWFDATSTLAPPEEKEEHQHFEVSLTWSTIYVLFMMGVFAVMVAMSKGWESNETEQEPNQEPQPSKQPGNPPQQAEDQEVDETAINNNQEESEKPQQREETNKLRHNGEGRSNKNANSSGRKTENESRQDVNWVTLHGPGEEATWVVPRGRARIQKQQQKPRMETKKPVVASQEDRSGGSIENAKPLATSTPRESSAKPEK